MWDINTIQVLSGVQLLKWKIQGTSHHLVNVKGVNYKKTTGGVIRCPIPHTEIGLKEVNDNLNWHLNMEYFYKDLYDNRKYQCVIKSKQTKFSSSPDVLLIICYHLIILHQLSTWNKRSSKKTPHLLSLNWKTPIPSGWFPSFKSPRFCNLFQKAF